METAKPRFEKYLFVCTNQRTDGRPCCSPPDLETGAKLKETLKTRVKELKLTHLVRVSSSGCQDNCTQGPNILITPDNVWLKGVSLSDVETIVQNYLAPLKEHR